jgi:hypothetical protein
MEYQSKEKVVEDVAVYRLPQGLQLMAAGSHGSGVSGLERRRMVESSTRVLLKGFSYQNNL